MIGGVGAGRWYAGDLHSHSTVSDGVLPPGRLVAEAEREGLDFFAITDHNRWAYPSFEDAADLLVIPGMEVTMPYGHFNVFGEDGEEPDWIGLLPRASGETSEVLQAGAARELLAAARADGLRSSINHPRISPWAWWDPEADLGAISYLEVWNDPTWPENRSANPATLDMWTRWLNAGLRVTAVGGSDFHDPTPKRRRDGVRLEGHRVGVPRTYVRAEARTAAAILAGLDAGRAYVTMGPTIELAGTGPRGEPVGIGNDLGDVEGSLEIEASCAGSRVLTLELVTGRGIVARAEGRQGAGVRLRLDLSRGRAGWLRVDVRDGAGEVVAFTNPIFHGPPAPPRRHRYGMFTDMTPFGRGASLSVDVGRS